MTERYQNLALTLRPQQFKNFIYNDHIVTILKNIVTSGKIPAGLLFSGSRGLGKTTLSRLFARAINCNSRKTAEPCGKCESCQLSMAQRHPDILEISGSTNGNIEDIRRIIEQAMLTPAIGNYKVFIIDEAQGLGRSTASWNSLLKILEEPPPHVVWLFCTTEKVKIPETIKSRLITLDLKLIPTPIIENYLKKLLADVKGESVAPVVARVACNSMRDALTLLEKVILYCKTPKIGFTEANALIALGAFDETKTACILDAINRHDCKDLWCILEGLVDSGVDFDTLYNDALVAGVTNLMGVMLGAQVDRGDLYQPFVQMGSPRILYLSDVLARRSKQFHEAENKKFVLRLIALELCA